MQALVNVIGRKWGPMYGPERVTFLRDGVERHRRLFRIVCFTVDARGFRDDLHLFSFSELVEAAAYEDEQEHLAGTMASQRLLQCWPPAMRVVRSLHERLRAAPLGERHARPNGVAEREDRRLCRHAEDARCARRWPQVASAHRQRTMVGRGFARRLMAAALGLRCHA